MDKSYLESAEFKVLKHRYKKELIDSFLYLEDYQKELSRSYDEKIKGKRSSDIIAEKYGISERTVRNRLRYTYVIPRLYEAYANNRIEMYPMTYLSYLGEEEQEILVELLNKDYKITKDKAKILKKEGKNNKLSKEDIVKIITDDNKKTDCKDIVKKKYKFGDSITINADVPLELDEKHKYEYTLKKLEVYVKEELSTLNSYKKERE